MTRTLILMRHAKSDWDTPALPDHDRTLTKRGQRSALALGDWMREKGWLPDTVLCSTAIRTRQTLEGLRMEAPVQFLKALYHAEAEDMHRTLKAATAPTVLMIGHNPGIGDFAHELLDTPPDHPRFEDYPTGATLVAEFDIEDWSELGWGKGHARDFIVPRELT